MLRTARSRGVFARRALEEGAVVGQYTGHGRAISTVADCRSEYVMIMPLGAEALARERAGLPYEKFVIDARTCGSEMRFLNHYGSIAEEPNVEFEHAAVGAGGVGLMEIVCTVRTLRRVEKGEELLVDYGDQYWG